MSNSTTVSTIISTDFSTITGLLGAVLAILLAGLVLVVSRYVPKKYIDFVKARMGHVHEFSKDPAGTMRSMVDKAVSDPGQALKDLSQAVSDAKNEISGNEVSGEPSKEPEQSSLKIEESSKEPAKEPAKPVVKEAKIEETKLPSETVLSDSSEVTDIETGQVEEKAENPDQKTDDKGLVKVLYDYFSPR